MAFESSGLVIGGTFKRCRPFFTKQKIKQLYMQLTRSNRRKTTKYRRTQVIDVPKYIMRNGLNKNDTNMANIIKKRGNPELHPDLFEINKSKWAGRRKFIFHTPQAY